MVRIRTTEDREQLGRRGFDPLPGVRVDVVRVAIEEGCPDAIGSSFPSRLLLSKPP